MIPLSFRSVAARLNISKDKGPVLTWVEVIGDGSNQNGWNGIDAVVERECPNIMSDEEQDAVLQLLAQEEQAETLNYSEGCDLHL